MGVGDISKMFLPNAVEDEEELDEDATEGKYSTHHYTRDGFSEKGLLRNLTGDLICPDWLLDCLRPTEKKR